MGVNGEKKIRVSAEQIFDVICLAASYGILFLLPEKIRFSFSLLRPVVFRQLQERSSITLHQHPTQ